MASTSTATKTVPVIHFNPHAPLNTAAAKERDGDDDSSVDSYDPDEQNTSAARKPLPIPPTIPTAPQPEPVKHDEPYIAYKNRYRDHEFLLLIESASDEPIELDKHTLIGDREPAFEIVNNYTSAVQWSRKTQESATLPPPVSGEPWRSITIRSPHILTAIRAAIQYYPQVSLSKPIFHVSAPYRVLVHHYDFILKYRNQLESGEAKTEITLLLNFLDREVMKDVAAERERNARGLVTFDMLWLALRPDSHIAMFNSTSQLKGGVFKRNAAVIATVYGGPRAGERRAYEIGAWNLQYDGAHISRKGHNMTIQPFAGELPVDRLEAAPLDMLGDLGIKLQEQGKIWYQLLQKPQCKQHSGAILNFPFTVNNDRVMVDVVAALDAKDPESQFDAIDLELKEERLRSLRLRADDSDEYISDDDLDRIRPRRKEFGDRKRGQALRIASLPKSSLYSDYDEIKPNLVDELSERQYMLCPQSISVWHFKTREWVIAAVSNLKDPVFDAKIMDKLVLDEQRRTLLQALSNGFMMQEDGTTPQPHWAADFIQGKGASQIFLLHGPPGVGKTFTAECMSEYTRRPLMTLTSSDIGNSSHEIEQRLDKNFKLAKKWGTILLIDEADVFLEDRKVTDLQRNGLVAAFLRALEMLEGILFLTTNRVGTFDDAFMSRIHVTMYYPPLTHNDRRKIWENFFDKLRRERTEFRIMPEVEDFIDRSKMKKLELNGREIRNIFQTTVSLAQFSPDKDDNGKIMIKKGHIEQVANMSGEFKKYLVKVWNQSEGERARGRLLRLDDFGGEKKNHKKDIDSDSDSD